MEKQPPDDFEKLLKQFDELMAQWREKVWDGLTALSQIRTEITSAKKQTS